MFDTVLIANRGEIAMRIIATLRRIGIRSVAVYSDADADAPHVRSADAAVRIGPTPARQSYLDPALIVAAADATGAQAIHPGYGFLSEDPRLARACEDAGIVFIGPPADVIARMGDKIAAKEAAIAANVPVVPGRHDAGMDDQAIAAAVADVGFPALLKPSAGGGGKGMRVIEQADQIEESIAGARREALASFGDDALLIERLVTSPRHIEVQVLADAHGHVVHLGERECTLQRRHQKVIEEAPSVFLDDAVRAELCASAVRLAESVGYVNAGTVEYVVPGDAPGDFAFLEMNTRLQVEHPVTEMVTGLDLVEWQIRIAAGEPLTLDQDGIQFTGHAVEARIYAEDPAQDFVPTGGVVRLWQPAAGMRTDSGIATGQEISSAYDPMLAKAIAHAPTRGEALRRLREGLSKTVLLGVPSNIDYLAWLAGQPEVIAGEMDTGTLGRLRHTEPETDTKPETDTDLVVMAAVALLPEAQDTTWRAGDSWRLGGPAPLRWDLQGREVTVRGESPRVSVTVEGEIHELAGVLPPGVVTARDDDVLWLHAPELGHRQVSVHRPIDRHIKRRAADADAEGHWRALSPMPGTVIEVPVAVGDLVDVGAPVAVVEAMKMEHSLRAPWRGRVVEVSAGPGSTVARHDALVILEPVQQEG